MRLIGIAVASVALIALSTPLQAQTADERPAAIFAKKVFYDTRACTTKIAIQYKELMQGSSEILKDFLGRECALEDVVREALLASNVLTQPNAKADGLSNLGAFMLLCGTVDALKNLKYADGWWPTGTYAQCSNLLAPLGVEFQWREY